MFCAYVSLSERRSSASSSGVRGADRARHGVVKLQPANIVAKGAAVAVAAIDGAARGGGNVGSGGDFGFHGEALLSLIRPPQRSRQGRLSAACEALDGYVMLRGRTKGGET